MLSRAKKTNDVVSQEFYQFPKALLYHPALAQLPLLAKMAYVVLNDRLALSVRSGWHNDEGEVYVIFRPEEMAQVLGVTERTVRTCYKQLVEAGLIREEYHGQGRPKMMYIDALDLSMEQAETYAAQSGDRMRGHVQEAEDVEEEEQVQESLKSPTQIGKGFRFCSESFSEQEQKNVPNRSGKNCRPCSENFSGQEWKGASVTPSYYINNTEYSNTEWRGTRARARAGTATTQLEALRAAYIQACPALPMPQPVERWSAERRSVAQRFPLSGDELMQLFARVQASDFLTGRKLGRDGRPFVATLDWILKDGHWQGVFEGKYDNEGTAADQPSFDLAAYERHRFDEVLGNDKM